MLRSMNVNSDVIKMIMELDEKAKEIIKRDPQTAGAWGAGCGGVTC